jgi:hypothetical protein
MTAHNCFKIFPEASLHKWVFFVYLALLRKIEYCKCYIESVPLLTKPGSSLVILPLMRILQRNLNTSTFVMWEMKRNVSLVRLVVTRSSGPPASQPDSWLTRLSAYLSVIWLRVPTQYGFCSWV